MKRNKHSLSNYKLLTAPMGKLIPIGWFEALPGDTVQQATSLLVRVSPLVAPVMHPVSVRVHHWFVPNRLIHPGWEDFITGGNDGLGDGTAAPDIELTAGVPAGSIGDYLGIPPGKAGLRVSSLPVRAYTLIYNEFYRDQDLVTAQNLLDDNIITGTPYQVAWEKDYFTSARPWPQKGPTVTMPLGDSAPVISAGTNTPKFLVDGVNGVNLTAQAGQQNAVWGLPGNASAASNAQWADPSLIADLSNATSVDVNDVRLAFALQRYQEARARYGSRYTEYLRYLGVRSSDARLQRPEYLGGGKQTISFSEVLVTGTGLSADDPVGTMKGHGISAMRSRRYRRFFEEHGIVISLLSVRPRTIYTDGLYRGWSRFTKEDYWQKELETIGQQEVFSREVYAEADNAGTGGDKIFGYQDRYSEYKHLPSTVHGEFRQLLNYWHMGRSFASQPALNASFVNCDPTTRIYADQTGTDPLWIMANNSIQARRQVTKSPASRII